MRFQSSKSLLFMVGMTIFVPLAVQAQPAIPLFIDQVGDLDAKIISLDAEVAGKIKRFYMDTGADSTMIQSDEQTLKFSVSQVFEQNGLSGSKIGCAQVLIPTFGVGNDEHSNFLANRCDGGKGGFNNLGLSFFANRIVTLDIKHSKLKIEGLAPQHGPYFPLDRVTSGQFPLLTMPLTIGSESSRGVFDTGTAITAVDKKYVMQHSGLFELISGDSHSSDINGQDLAVSIYKVKSLQVGSLILHDIYVSSFDFNSLRDILGEDTPIILGNNVILHANWIIDLKANRWAVDPN